MEKLCARCGSCPPSNGYAKYCYACKELNNREAVKRYNEKKRLLKLK